MPDYSLAVKAGLVKENPKEVDAYVLVNGSRQGAINWMRDNKWEYGFDDEAINIVEEDERIPTRLIQWFVREASKGNLDLYEDTEEALSNWKFLKDSLGDQTVVNHIKKEYEIKTPKNPLLYSSGDLNGIANWYHSLFEAPPLPDDYQKLLKYTEENSLPHPVGGQGGPQWHEWAEIRTERGLEPDSRSQKGRRISSWSNQRVGCHQANQGKCSRRVLKAEKQQLVHQRPKIRSILPLRPRGRGD